MRAYVIDRGGEGLNYVLGGIRNKTSRSQTNGLPDYRRGEIAHIFCNRFEVNFFLPLLRGPFR